MANSQLSRYDTVDNFVRSDVDGLIGHLIGHLRRANGLTVRQLASATHLDEVRLASIEVGISPLDIETTEAIAPALGVQVSDLHDSVHCIVRFLDTDLRERGEPS